MPHPLLPLASLNQATLNLFDACSLSDPRRALLAIDAGANVNAKTSKGFTPVIYAIAEGSNGLGCLELLADRGADLNACDPNGWSPTIYAANQPCLATLAFLASRGADLNTQDKAGRAPIFFCARSGALECLQLLVQRGADLALTDHNQWSALEHATHSGQQECAAWIRATLQAQELRVATPSPDCPSRPSRI